MSSKFIVFPLLALFIGHRAAFSEERTVAAGQRSLEERVTHLETEVRELKQQLSAKSSNKDVWVQRLKELRDHNSTAFIVGAELTLVEPDLGLEIVQQAWPLIQVSEVKTGLLKAFHFGKKLRPKRHPAVLHVLHLGMTDPDDAVRRYAATYMKELAGRDFTDDKKAYEKWRSETEDKTLDQVVHAKGEQVPEQLKRDLAEMTEAFSRGNLNESSSMAQKVSETQHPYAIPTLIGIIDADNSYDTVYGVGRWLGAMTDVEYSSYHDGAWWRRWWEKNKKNYPEVVRNQNIPALPKTEHGKSYKPFSEEMDTLQGKLRFLQELEQLPSRTKIWNLADEIAKHKDPSAIPVLIGFMDADNTYDTIYGIGYYGLGKLTGVTYDESHNSAWWRNWWNENKSKYPAEVQNIEVPKVHLNRTTSRNNNTSTGSSKQGANEAPALDLRVASESRMRYFLIGPRPSAPKPKDGYKLLVVLPGGSGDEAFHPFVRKIHSQSLGDDFLIVQPVAFKWHPDQQIVWPTAKSNVQDQKFSTEEFVQAVINDASNRQMIDKRNVFTLSWSSSGPAAYAIALQEKTPVTGSFIAMSVFKPDSLGPLTTARQRRFYLLHSKEDRLCPYWMAKSAKEKLSQEGGQVTLVDYEGGHGWHGDLFGNIRQGVQWLLDSEQSPR